MVFNANGRTKLLSCKDICSVLNTIKPTLGVQPHMIERPGRDDFNHWLLLLVENAYDEDADESKATLVQAAKGAVEHPEFHESMQFMVFRRASKMLKQCGIAGFCQKDMWVPPAGKEARLILSGLINMCRFMETSQDMFAQDFDDVEKLEKEVIDAGDQEEEEKDRLRSLAKYENELLVRRNEEEVEIHEELKKQDKVKKAMRESSEKFDRSDRMLREVYARKGENERVRAEVIESIEIEREKVAMDYEGLPEKLANCTDQLEESRRQGEERREEHTSKSTLLKNTSMLQMKLETITNDHIGQDIKGMKKAEACREKLTTMEQAKQAIESKVQERMDAIQEATAKCNSIAQEIKQQRREFEERDDEEEYNKVFQELRALQQKQQEDRDEETSLNNKLKQLINETEREQRATDLQLQARQAERDEMSERAVHELKKNAAAWEGINAISIPMVGASDVLDFDDEMDTMSYLSGAPSMTPISTMTPDRVLLGQPMTPQQVLDFASPTGALRGAISTLTPQQLADFPSPTSALGGG